MSRKIYFQGRERRKDGLSNFLYLIEEGNRELPGTIITIVVHGRWYDEEMMRIGKLDIPHSRSTGVLIRYMANEALEQYDKFTSGDDDSTHRVIPPDRAVDFDEIMNIARGEFPKVILPDKLFGN